MLKSKILTAVLILVWQLGLPLFVNAAAAPTKLAIPGTELQLNGYASPGALVQIYDNGALIGSVVADSAGAWQKDFPSLDSGLHSLRMFYEDSSGRSSASVEDVLNIRSQNKTTASYYLPPTLNVLPDTVTEGGVVSIVGSSRPNSTIDIAIDGGGLILRPQADSQGNYAIAFNTTSFYGGEHIAQGTSRFGQEISYQTNVNTFNVQPIDATDEIPDGLPPPIITTPSPVITDDPDTVIRGTTVPSAQIVAFLDNNEVGSTFANQDGDWFITIRVTKPSHELRVRACLQEQCSEFSNLLEITVGNEAIFAKAFCPVDFQLSRYRYWGINQSNQIELDLVNLREVPPYELLINWGDGTSEKFNHDQSSRLSLNHRFDSVGQFNGSATLVDASGCEHTRYFSVDVLAQEFDWRWLLAAIPILLGSLVAMVIRMRRKLVSEAAAHPDPAPLPNE